jgi:cystathionine beta-lyase/cystathionine gamma-synthase
MFDVILPRFGVTTTYVDGTRIENFERAILPATSLIYLESPNSWDYKLQDLSAIAELARAEGIVTIIDNSYCTPLYQQPIGLGIDISMQTATKYIGGHSDTVGGVLTGSRERMKKIFESEYLNIGSGIQPFNAWLLIRGLRTLPARLERISRTTRQVVDYLKGHPRVESVLFPLDETFPQLALARRQMKGACGLLSFYVRAESRVEIVRFCERLRHIFMAVSWGGHESLILPKCAGLTAEEFDADNPEHRMLRLYTGLEDAAYIIDDLEQAFAAAW